MYILHLTAYLVRADDGLVPRQGTFCWHHRTNTRCCRLILIGVWIIWCFVSRDNSWYSSVSL